MGKKTIDFLFVLNGEKSKASSRYRGFYITEELQKRGYECKTVIPKGYSDYVKILIFLLFSKVILIQKRFNYSEIIIANISRIFGKILILDIDDSPRGTASSLESEKKCIKLIKSSSFVFVGSETLKHFAQKYNESVYLFNTPVKEEFCSPFITKNSSTVIGWIGNGINYKKELHFVYNALLSIQSKVPKKDIILRLVGVMKDRDLHDSIVDKDNLSVELIDSINWEDEKKITEIIASFDIGVYPILEGSYNKFKGGFKVIQFSSCGVPFITSKLYENEKLTEDPAQGLLVQNTREEWEEALIRLIKNPDLRKEMGNYGYQKIIKTFTVSKYVDNMVKIVEGS